MQIRYLVVAVSAIVLIASIRFASTSPMRLEEVGPALAPYAHTRFCIRYPDECQDEGKDKGRDTGIRKDADKNLKMSTNLREKLEAVNTQVNEEIEPWQQAHSAVSENWLINPARGDCNDYAVSKRSALIKLGVPADALLLAEVTLRSGEHHLVVIIRTTDVDLVLDNRYARIRTVAEADKEYTWVRMESERNPMFWSKVRSPA